MATETVTIVIRERGSKVAARGVRRVSTASRSAAGSVRLLSSALIALGGALSVKALIDIADSATLIQNKVTVATDSVAEMNAVLDRLRDISNGTRTGLEDNAALFQRLSSATSELGASQSEVLDVVEGLNAAVAISGATSSEAAAAVQQLGQALGSGTFAGDELRSVIENMNPLARALAEELGTTVGQLKVLGAEGKLTSDVVFPALQRATARFKDELGGIGFTTEQTFNLLRTEITFAIGAINNVLGASTFLNNGIISLSESIGVILVEAFATMIDGVALALTTVGNLSTALDAIGIEVIPSLGESFAAFGAGTNAFLQSIQLQVNKVRLAFEVWLTAMKFALNSVGLLSQSSLDEQMESLSQATQRVATDTELMAAAAQEVNQAYLDIASNTPNTEAFGEDLQKRAADARDLSTALRELVADGRITAEEFTQLEGAGLGDGTDAGTGVAVGAGISPEEVPVDIVPTASDGEVEGLGEDFGRTFGRSASRLVGELMEGESADIWGAFADIGGNLLQDQLEKTFKDIGTELGATLEEAFEGVDLAGFGGAIAGVAGGAIALGIGAAQGNDARTRNSLVNTAIESAQATRGIVAGPTSIPIFQVGAQLEAAMDGTEALLQRILDAIIEGNGLLAGVGTTSGAASAPAPSAGTNLSTQSALLT